MDNLHDKQIGDYIFVSRLPSIKTTTMILIRCVHCGNEKRIRRYDFLRGKGNCHCKVDRSSAAKRMFIAMADYKCNTCGIHEWNGEHIVLDIDHIIPIKLGGINSPENMQYLCPNCHRIKTAHEFDW